VVTGAASGTGINTQAETLNLPLAMLFFWSF
jgi:hypothetical protein